MKTWEVCADSNNFSYMIHLNRKYAVAMGGLSNEVKARLTAMRKERNNSDRPFPDDFALEGVALRPPKGYKHQPDSEQEKEEAKKDAATEAEKQGALGVCVPPRCSRW